MLLGAFHAVPGRAAVDRAVFVGLGASVRRIEAPARRGGYAIGSGVAVGRDQAITTCHVTGDAPGNFVVRSGSTRRASCNG